MFVESSSITLHCAQHIKLSTTPGLPYALPSLALSSSDNLERDKACDRTLRENQTVHAEDHGVDVEQPSSRPFSGRQSVWTSFLLRHEPKWFKVNNPLQD